MEVWSCEGVGCGVGGGCGEREGSGEGMEAESVDGVVVWSGGEYGVEAAGW